MVFNFRHLVLSAALSILASPAGQIACAQKIETKADILEAYQTAYRCLKIEEFLCASYHFEKIILFEEVFSSEDLAKIKIDNAISIYLLHAADQTGSIDLIFDPIVNFRRAKQLLREANYEQSYTMVAVNLHLLSKFEDTCSEAAKNVLHEVNSALVREEVLIDKPAFTVEETNAMEALFSIYRNRMEGCK